jgi:DNA anti-recombination protein RmuC
LDDKIDIAVESMKDYVDIKFDRMQGNFNEMQNNFNGMQNNFDQMQTNFNQLGGKLDTAVKGIVDIIERSIGDRAKMEDQVQNHEQRISYLETKTG